MSAGVVITLEVQEAIARTAQGILTAPYAGVKVKEFEPQRRTLMHDAWHGNKLSYRHQEAWRRTVNLFRDAEGSSPRSSSYGEAIGGGESDGFRVPTAGENPAMERLRYLCETYLPNHESRLLRMLMLETFQAVKMYSLEQLGKHMSGYGDSAQARAAAIGRLHGMLDSLAEFHGI